MAIGSVSVSVHPDAEGFWRDFTAQTRGKAEQAGRSAGRDFIRSMQAEAERGVKVRVRADTTRARAEIAALGSSSSKSFDSANKSGSALITTIAALAPAAIPIAGVLGGALAGLVPTIATLALGIKGISDEFDSGALAGTQYGKDIGTLQGELSKLEAIAAGGLLNGLDKALQGSGPLFKVVNSDVQVMATQIGDIAAGAGPALLAILNDLNPLFVTFGNVLTRGAQELEHFATSSDGISKFASYVQAELPVVLQTLGRLVVLVGHTAEAFAPLGSTVLRIIDGLAGALDALPIGALRALEVGALAAFLAFKGYTAINGIVNSVSGSIARLGAIQSASALRAEGAATATAAAAAEQAAAVATANAATAEAAADSALAQAAAARTVSASAAAEAQTVADAKVAEAEAYLETAGVAEVAAAETAAAAQAAALAIREAGAAAQVGYAGLLGPIGALVIGVGILGAAFLGSSHDSEAATEANSKYAESVKQSTDALSSANLAATNENLSKQGALAALTSLHSANDALGVSYGTLTKAVNGSQTQYDGLISKLKDVAAANRTTATDNAGNTRTTGYNDQGTAALKLVGTLGTLRSSLSKNIKAQQVLNEAQRETINSANGGSAQTRAQAVALGINASAYLTAEQAAKSNTDQTHAQTQAFQVENDAASLLTQALQGLAGNNLNIATAQTSLASANLQVAASFKQNGDQITGNTAKAVANQQAIQSSVQAAQQLAEATGKQKDSSIAATRSFRDSRDALESQLKSQGKLTPAVQAYINKLFNLKNLHVPPTKLDVNPAPALAKATALQDTINAIRQGNVPGIDADTAAGQAKIDELQARINALQGKTVNVTTNVVTTVTEHGGISHGNTSPPPKHPAHGGTIYGPGSATSDSIPAMLSNGEEVINARQAEKHRALLKAINAGTDGFAHGGTVGFASGGTAAKQRISSALSAATGALGSIQIQILPPSPSALTQFEHSISKAVDKIDAASRAGVSDKRVHQLRSQLQDLVHTANVQLGNLRVKINTQDLGGVRKALTGTAADIAAAFTTVATDLKAAGISGKELDKLRKQIGGVEAAANARNATLARLGTAPARQTAYERLANAQQNFESTRSSVANTVGSSFDVASAGAGFDGNQPISGASIVAQEKQAALKAAKFQRDIAALSKKGLNATDLNALYASGPGALAQVDALLNLSKGNLASVNASRATITGAARATGLAAASGADGQAVKVAQTLVTTLKDQAAADLKREQTREDHLETRIANALHGWRIVIDSKGQARLVKTGDNKNKRRK